MSHTVRSCASEIPLTASLGAVGITALAAEFIVGVTFKEGIIIGVCAEMTGRVASYATQYFIKREAVIRNAERMEPVLLPMRRYLVEFRPFSFLY